LLKYSVLFTDDKGESHFRRDELKFASTNFAPPAPPVDLTEFIPASNLVFFRIPKGWFGDWHPAPKKQFFCCLSGQVELTASDGETQSFRPGDVFLLEDTTGKGHQTKVVGDGDFVAAIVQLANQEIDLCAD
jgi:quercetin dioxygenase-like cupin family protein